MDDAFAIVGGRPLRGQVTVSGAKNIALKVITAALLFKGEVIIENIPRIRDVIELMNLISGLGAEAAFIGHNTVHLKPETLTGKTVDLAHASKIRTSFMLFAPLLHTFGEAHIPNPGGCRLGARPIDRIIDGMRQLGVRVAYESETGYFHATLENHPGGTYRFPKASHTGTELLIMLAALSNSTSVIENAALEPEIDDLIQFLNDGGARITRKGSVITVQGVSELRQKNPYTIANDRNEAATYAVMAYATRGDVTVHGVVPEHLKTFHEYMIRVGGVVEQVGQSSMRYRYETPLKAVTIETGPHPGFMTDWQPPVAILLTQAQGTSHIHERMFENRFSYVAELKKLGARIDFEQPKLDNPALYYEFNYDEKSSYQQAIRIEGPTELHNAVLNIADLRAGATLAIGALIAQGESIVYGASHLERGYEDFVGKVRALGGDIRKAASLEV